MKKIIATLVGGIILFMWQFMSWQALQLHSSQASYTPKQDQILDALAKIGLEEGEYALPTYKPNATQEEIASYSENIIGKPWAVLRYKKEFKDTMVMNLIRGLVLNLCIVFGLVYFIGMLRDINFKNIMLVCLGFGLLSYMIHPYLYSVWFENDTIPNLIDSVVQFLLLGGWLGFWMTRKK